MIRVKGQAMNNSPSWERLYAYGQGLEENIKDKNNDNQSTQ